MSGPAPPAHGDSPRSLLQRRTGRTLLALGLILLVSGLATLSPTRASESASRIIVVPALSKGEEPPDPSALRAVVAGNEQAVLSVRQAGQWNVVVAVDAQLSTGEGLAAAVELLSSQAEALVSLGSVRIVSIDSRVAEILSASGNASDFRDALAAYATGASSGELIRLRQGLGPDADRLERLEVAQQEWQLLRWQREALADWLLTTPIAAPKALFLIQNGFDFTTELFYGLTTGEFAGSPSPAFDDRILGAALAATGWNAFPIAATTVDPTLDRSLVGEPLAAATGGLLVRDAVGLQAAIEQLAGALEVGLAVGTAPVGPLPLELSAANLEIAPPQWIGGAFVPGRAAARARRYLIGTETGEIQVSARILYDGPDEESVVVEVATELGAIPPAPSSEWLSLALYLDQLDAAPLEIELQGRAVSLAGANRWIAQCALDLPDDRAELVAVITDAKSGRWGATVVEDEGSYLTRQAPGLVVEQFDLRPARAEKVAETEPDTTIRLLAPSGGALTGRQRFQTLVTSSNVARVVFFLDEKQVEEDTDAPFSARIDLGRRPARHSIRVDAYDALDRLVGSDSIRLNEPMRSFDVSIAAVEQAASGSLAVEASVSHPTDVAVERVEIYYNESLVEELQAPPWRVAIAAPGVIGTTDYVRAVAYLDDGRFLEDVYLLAAQGSGESVEVNLVQVYVVATNRDGQPVANLTVDDFEVRLGGERQVIQRFAYADEVPLLLGLVIDTSPSMWTLMSDTKKAAARFLTQILTEKDQALVIDFDTRPRLAAPMTHNITDLLLSLGSMEAEPRGTTALFDSVIFGSLQLPPGQDRKALVLLTDGDDYKSRFGARRAIDSAKRAGVPVYVVSLAGLHDARRQFRRTEIEALTHQTGGEAYYLGDMGELGPTYDQIADELRSQYLLAFPTDRQLSEKDLESLRITVDRPALDLRTVTGGRSVN